MVNNKQTRTQQMSQKYQRLSGRAKGREERLDPNEIGGLLGLSESDDALLRCHAVQSLCPCHVRRNDNRIWDRLIKLASDPDPKVRATVFHTLGDGSPREREPEVVAALEAMYNDPDPKLRRRVRGFLAQYRRTGRINIL